VIIIMVGYALSVIVQVAVNTFIPESRLLALLLIFCCSVVMLGIALRSESRLTRIMGMQISVETTIADMTARFVRVVIAVGVFMFVYGSILQFDIASNLQYAQTVASGLINFSAAIVAILVIFFISRPRINSDTILPVAVVILASIIVGRLMINNSAYLSGAMMTTFVMFFGVLVWLMLILEAHEHKLSAFFLMGLVLGIDRISVLLGRLTINQLGDRFELTPELVFSCSLWLLCALIALHFYLYQRSLLQARKPAPLLEFEDSDSGEHLEPHRLTSELTATLIASYRLSAREAEIILAFSGGRSARKIAEEQVLSEHTIKTHVRRAYQKLGIHSRQALIDLVDGIGRELG
jgi:DNA-binding CsgD family transcriptional regulator